MTNNQQLAAITAEERAALVEYLGLTEEQRKDKYAAMRRYELRIMAEQIALASLEAERVGVMEVWPDSNRRCEFSLRRKMPVGDFDVYTAPPVAVMPIRSIRIQKALLWLDGIMLNNPGMKEPITCAEALRAVGGSVKE